MASTSRKARQPSRSRNEQKEKREFVLVQVRAKYNTSASTRGACEWTQRNSFSWSNLVWYENILERMRRMAAKMAAGGHFRFSSADPEFTSSRVQGFVSRVRVKKLHFTFHTNMEGFFI